jgi:hypothetical protein
MEYPKPQTALADEGNEHEQCGGSAQTLKLKVNNACKNELMLRAESTIRFFFVFGKQLKFGSRVFCAGTSVQFTSGKTEANGFIP